MPIALWGSQMISALLAVICLVPFISSQEAPASDVAVQLNTIHRAYLKGPDIAGLVELDGNIRNLIHQPWNRTGQSIDGKIFQPQWDGTSAPTEPTFSLSGESV